MKSLRTRLIITFVLMVLLPMAIFATVTSCVNLRHGRQVVRQQLEAAVRYRQDALSDWLDNLKSEVSTALITENIRWHSSVLLSQNDDLALFRQDSYNKMNVHFRKVLEETDRFDGMFLMTRDLKIVQSSSPVPGEYLLTSQTHDIAMLRQAITLAGLDPRSKDLIVLVLQPFFDSDGTVEGIIGAFTGAAKLHEIMQEHSGLGQTGEMLILDSNNAIISSSKEKNFQPATSGRYCFFSLSRQKANEYFIARDNQDVPVSCFYDKTPELDLYILAKQDNSEAFAATYASLKISAAVALLGFMCAILIGMLFTRHITAPLARLASSAEKISSGNLELAEIAGGGEEIEHLGEALQLMTSRLNVLISELKSEIDERQKTAEALRSSQAILQNVTQSIPGVVFRIHRSKNGHYSCQYISSQIKDFLDIDRDSFLRNPNIIQQFIAPEQFEELFQSIEQSAAALTNWIGDIPLRLANDQIRWVHGSSSPTLDDNGITWNGVFLDITDQKLAESNARNLQEQLLHVERMESIGTLAGGIAHDFNNLLMGIQGRVSMMLVDHEGIHHKEHLQAIEQYIKKAADLTRQILGFARGGKYEVKPTDINELIREQNKMFGRTHKAITIIENFAENLWTVEVDRGQIEQVILNLYVNAIHAMENKGRIEVITQNKTLSDNDAEQLTISAGKYVIIQVSDQGMGMDKATLKRIFEPFFTTKGRGHGTGLGLASVYGIINNHDGSIKVTSEPGKGSTFSLYLPATDLKAERIALEQKTITRGSGVILLVDDEKMIVDVGSQMLKSLGYSALTANSGVEAMEVFSQQKDDIDLVIVDMIMPGMDGEQTFDAIRSLNPEIKVLLCSGYSINDRIAAILERGCKGFIQKPFTMQILAEKIQDVLAS